MRGERMAERMWMQIPFHLHHARIFFHDGADGPRFETRAAHAEEHGFGIAAFRPLGANLIAHRPVRSQRLKRLITERNDTFFPALAEYANNLAALVNIAKTQPGKLAHTNARGVKQLENGTIAFQNQQFALAARRTRIAAELGDLPRA